MLVYGLASPIHHYKHNMIMQLVRYSNAPSHTNASICTIKCKEEENHDDSHNQHNNMLNNNHDTQKRNHPYKTT